MSTVALLLFLSLLFFCPTGYAIRDVFRQTARQRALPPQLPRDDDMLNARQRAVPSGWTALDDLQLTRLLLTGTSTRQRPTKSDEEKPDSEG